MGTHSSSNVAELEEVGLHGGGACMGKEMSNDSIGGLKKLPCRFKFVAASGGRVSIGVAIPIPNASMGESLSVVRNNGIPNTDSVVIEATLVACDRVD
ncbi:hypothetical protein L1987_23398 [Smallanthus sonchifolius]|uniref:Uncharacterized protein n=1 Tax=Smallanthus sonchifolius TaxID=185202 RepID=A0ACB9IHQ4_9ASTR|nr:hypothetical protein L1987_23398 [Smallanthus sonchifolius]